jgi:nicotinamide-nucleotide amidase
MFSESLLKQAEQLLAACRTRKTMLVTAESCTGGLLSSLLTEIPGSSDVFERGFITYSNQAKIQLLKVNETVLAECGAVSLEVASAMAIGALENSNGDMSVATTGIAGPGGGTDAKPVGLVYIALGGKKTGRVLAREFRFSGGRSAIRLQAVEAATALLMEHLAHFA